MRLQSWEKSFSFKDHETEIVESSMSFSSMTRESRGLSLEVKQLSEVLWLFFIWIDSCRPQFEDPPLRNSSILLNLKNRNLKLSSYTTTLPENAPEGTVLTFEGGMDKVQDLDKVSGLEVEFGID